MDLHNYNYSIAGFTAGLSYTFIGHPLDTIKTWKQNNNIIKTPSFNFKNLFKGIKYPLIQNSLISSIIFSNNEFFKKNINNIYVSNGLTALITSIIICPCDKYKIMEQNKKIYPFNFKNTINSYKDIGIVTARKFPGIFIYFSSYQLLKKNDVPTFLSGSIAGASSWFFTYPIDTIKTRIQNESCKTIKEAINKGGLNNGIGICLLRAFIVNGINFTVYENALKYLD